MASFPDHRYDQQVPGFSDRAYYQFVLIGEALAQLRAMGAGIEDCISESARIIGFRNQVIHGYARIDDEITWRIIEQKLSVLRAEVDQLLKE